VITCLCLLFVAIVVKLKLGPKGIAWLGVGFVLPVVIVVAFWHLDAPMSSRVVTTQYVVQLVPYVKGQIKKVHAKANQPMKRGAVLVEIDASPYQDAVNQLQAQLAGSKDNVKLKQAALQSSEANVVKAGADIKQAQAAVTQSKAVLTNARAGLTKAKAGLASAQAGVVKAKASDVLAKTEEQIALNLRKMDAGAISKLRVAQAQQKLKEADAALKQAQGGADEAGAGVQQAEAGVNQARAAVWQAEAGLAQAQSGEQQARADERQAGFALQMAQSNVPAVKAQLDDALFNLAQCTMYAPADGYIVDWQVQEGSWVSPIRLLAIGAFIVTGDISVVAVFPQNFLMNVQAGDEVELILDPYPGRLFKAKVDTVITATGEGQYAPSQAIPEASQVGSRGLLAVKIRLIDEDPPANLPLGAGGTVAIYTDRGKPVHVISKVSIRMKKWLLYVVPSVKR
jgi:multidrug resistance efflux pump